MATDLNSLTLDQKLEIAWAAGLFEGEGYFGPKAIGEGNCYPQVTLNSTDYDVILRWVTCLGEWMEVILNGPYTSGSRLGKKTFWVTNINGYEKPQFIACLFWPYLGERRKEQIRSTLQFTNDLFHERNNARPQNRHSRRGVVIRLPGQPRYTGYN